MNGRRDEGIFRHAAFCLARNGQAVDAAAKTGGGGIPEEGVAACGGGTQRGGRADKDVAGVAADAAYGEWAAGDQIEVAAGVIGPGGGEVFAARAEVGGAAVEVERPIAAAGGAKSGVV